MDIEQVFCVISNCVVRVRQFNSPYGKKNNQMLTIEKQALRVKHDLIATR